MKYACLGVGGILVGIGLMAWGTKACKVLIPLGGIIFSVGALM